MYAKLLLFKFGIQIICSFICGLVAKNCNHFRNRKNAFVSITISYIMELSVHNFQVILIKYMEVNTSI